MSIKIGDHITVESIIQPDIKKQFGVAEETWKQDEAEQVLLPPAQLSMSCGAISI